MGTGKNKDSKGLCSNCRSADICLYRKNQKSDPQFCEMYEVDWSLENNPETKSDKPAADPPPVKSPAEEKLVGLCVNCEHRHTCKLHKPAGGVWHCEEYE